MVLPHAMVCEIVKPIQIEPLPGTPPWVLGYCIWRGSPVSVMSFEHLLEVDAADAEPRRLIVMHPLPGRHAYDHFAITSCGEPSSVKIGADVGPATPRDVPLRFVAGGVDLPGGPGIIPDFDALKAVFYPA